MRNTERTIRSAIKQRMPNLTVMSSNPASSSSAQLTPSASSSSEDSRDDVDQEVRTPLEEEPQNNEQFALANMIDTIQKITEILPLVSEYLQVHRIVSQFNLLRADWQSVCDRYGRDIDDVRQLGTEVIAHLPPDCPPRVVDVFQAKLDILAGMQQAVDKQSSKQNVWGEAKTRIMENKSTSLYRHFLMADKDDNEDIHHLFTTPSADDLAMVKNFLNHCHEWLQSHKRQDGQLFLSEDIGCPSTEQLDMVDRIEQQIDDAERAKEELLYSDYELKDYRLSEARLDKLHAELRVLLASQDPNEWTSDSHEGLRPATLHNTTTANARGISTRSRNNDSMSVRVDVPARSQAGRQKRSGNRGRSTRRKAEKVHAGTSATQSGNHKGGARTGKVKRTKVQSPAAPRQHPRVVEASVRPRSVPPTSCQQSYVHDRSSARG